MKVDISRKRCSREATFSTRSKTWVTSISVILFVPVAMSPTKNGSERLNFTAFYEALLEAKGVSLGMSNIGGVGKGGRKLIHVATVQGNDNLLIGKAHIELLDLEPGSKS